MEDDTQADTMRRKGIEGWPLAALHIMGANFGEAIGRNRRCSMTMSLARLAMSA